MVKSKKRDSKKEQKEKDSELIKKILKGKFVEKTSKEQEKTSEKDKSSEDDSEEVQEPEVFLVPQQETSLRRRTHPILEETFAIQDSPRDENLEGSLLGVETPKKKENSKDFYSSVSYSIKNEEQGHKYGGPIQQQGIAPRREDRGSITVGDIRGNQFVTNGINSDVKKEIAEYNSHSPDEKYNVQHLERMDSTDLNRDRNKNPFLQDVEVNEIRYE